MARILIALFICIFAFSLAGCFHFKARTNTIKAAILPPYTGLKARIMIVDFDIKADKVNSEAAFGLKEMLVAALNSSNRFSIVDPKNEEKVLLINISVTKFEPEASGGRDGIGGGGGSKSGALGGLLGDNMNKAHIALSLRIVDKASGNILIAARNIQGQASDNIMTSFSNIFPLGSGLSGYTNTPMEKAIRTCIAEAVQYIWEGIPKSYYQY